MKSKVIVFTDLDGTLLDEKTYSFGRAGEALALLDERGIPLVINSSKTATEIIHYRDLLHNVHPFVSENGGGIFIPKGYFNVLPEGLDFGEKYGYLCVTLGEPYRNILKGLDQLKSMDFTIKGFSDMDVDEIVNITGLSLREAGMAKERDFDEPLVLDNNVNLKALREAIAGLGFSYTSGGRFIHIVGDSDKGRAVKVLKDMYLKNTGGDVVTVAIGDNFNDIPMLLYADYPVAVKKGDGAYDRDVMREVRDVIPAEGIGPAGFNESVIGILRELDEKT